MLYAVCYFVNQVFFISTSGEPSVKRIDLTLAGPTVTRLVQKTLAVLSLDNQLYILYI